MTSLRLLVSSVLLSLFLIGCQTGHEFFPARFYRVQVTDYRGQLVSDWIAHGYVQRTELGYRFRAVERISAPPFAQYIRYPEGRMVEVAGPNIVVTRWRQPIWYYERRVVTK